MLETVREYAREWLEESGEAEAVRDRHAAYYAAALGEWATDLKGLRQLEALQEIDADVDNARAAWNWAIEQGQVEWLDRALEGLCLFYEWRGRYGEGEAACQKAADRLEEPSLRMSATAESSQRLRVLAHALVWQGSFGHVLVRGELVDKCFERALAVLDGPGLGDQGVWPERAFALLRMAQRAALTDLKKVRGLAECSLATYRALGDRWGMAQALLCLAGVAVRLGAYDQVKQLGEESLALFRVLGDRRGVGWSFYWLGLSVDFLGQHEEAERLAREGMAIAKEAGDTELIYGTTVLLCTALHDSGRFAEEQSLREEELAFLRDRGVRREESGGMVFLGVAKRHLGSYGEARALARAALPLCHESGRRVTAGYCCMELGRLALTEGAYDEAREWLEQAVAAFQEFGMPYWTGEARATLAYYVARGLGQPAQARQHLRVALRMAAETGYRNVALQSLPAMALLLADGGEVERAVELYALASRYPYVANSRWFEDVAGKQLKTLIETLPPKAVAAAQERGRARDLDATVRELLNEMDGSLPG
jgi:tetratricopeptide (TPR) repeat protein